MNIMLQIDNEKAVPFLNNHIHDLEKNSFLSYVTADS